MFLCWVYHRQKVDCVSFLPSVYLSWIPGHCGVQANKEVDMIARTLANDIYKNRVFAPSATSLAAAVQMSAEIAKNLGSANGFMASQDIIPNC